MTPKMRGVMMMSMVLGFIVMLAILHSLRKMRHETTLHETQARVSEFSQHGDPSIGNGDPEDRKPRTYVEPCYGREPPLPENSSFDVDETGSTALSKDFSVGGEVTSMEKCAMSGQEMIRCFIFRVILCSLAGYIYYTT